MVTIRPVTDLDKDWPQLWPLFNEFLLHHAQLLGAGLPPNREHTTYKRLRKRLESHQGLVVVGDDNGELTIAGEGQIEESSVQPHRRVGHLGAVFVRPSSRGTALALRCLRWCEDWLRDRTVTQAEMTVLVENDRALRLWQHLGYAPYAEILRKKMDGRALPIVDSPSDVIVRKIGSLDDEWPRLSPLVNLQETELGDRRGNLAANTEESQRLRLETLAEKKSLILLAEAGGQAGGIASVRLAKNPWILDERVGIVEDFYCMNGANAGQLRSILDRAIESWLARKNAGCAQRTTTLMDAPNWRRAGYEPHLMVLRKDL